MIRGLINKESASLEVRGEGGQNRGYLEEGTSRAEPQSEEAKRPQECERSAET